MILIFQNPLNQLIINQKMFLLSINNFNLELDYHQ